MILLAAGLALLLSAPPTPTYPSMTGRVNDLDGKLSREDESRLERQLVALNETHDVVCVIAIIPWLERATVETYSLGLAKHWKIGDSTKNNGILILVAPRERKVRVEVGTGLTNSKTLTNEEAKQIVNTMIPYLRKQKGYDGFSAGIRALDQALQK